MSLTFRNILSSGFLEKLKLVDIPAEKKAISMTIGFYLGIFPIIGTTTILCLITILVFRINGTLVMTLNWMVYPLQIILVYPFLKMGRLLFYSDSHVLPDISVKQWYSVTSPEAFRHLFESAIGGIAIWAMISLISGYFLYKIFLKICIQIKNYSR